MPEISAHLPPDLWADVSHRDVEMAIKCLQAHTVPVVAPLARVAVALERMADYLPLSPLPKPTVLPHRARNGHVYEWERDGSGDHPRDSIHPDDEPTWKVTFLMQRK